MIVNLNAADSMYADHIAAATGAAVVTNEEFTCVDTRDEIAGAQLLALVHTLLDELRRCESAPLQQRLQDSE